MRRIVFSLILLLLVSFSTFSQVIIRGVVVNKEGGDPIAGCSVFISNTTNGTVTDSHGRFELGNIPAGKHDLVITSIGYETFAYNFSADQAPTEIKAEMTRKVRELSNVTVEPSVEETWEKWGRLFTDNFIGLTPDAARCKIRNEKAIRFRFFSKSNRLIAFCDEPIIIDNRALGYRIKYQLEDFEVNFREGTTAFAGFPFFEEMNRKGPGRKMLRNRSAAYYGSIMHFMRSLFNNDLASQGFEVRRMVRMPNLEKQRVKSIYKTFRMPRQQRTETGTITLTKGANDSLRFEQDSMNYYQRILQQPDNTDIYGKTLLTADSLITGRQDDYKVLYFPDYLLITYKKEFEDKAYLAYRHEGRSPAFQQSCIWLRNLQAVAVYANGSYYDPQEIYFMSYWAWNEKVAELLPLDYEPDR